ncbi:MAG: hypothetical protein A2Y67_04255 [Candidatus Buchananbacteria bacterium RBG_13_39_9]|uniref:Uncharacterized protein n=1 Tax=Candidatus Buchananbacteria bacterium RBG_13_39_9 TaxID=1797531 RepID=A0A1G1XR64_9BACT|nr:MAG: hypothetical protein A2Y67_04255 [Candidatus Buchananbacteria bacterium RBG_13_39_9]
MNSSSEHYKTLLLFPPNYHPILIHPSLPYLTAYLRSKGHNVVQKNLTPAAYRFLMPQISSAIDGMRSWSLYTTYPNWFLYFKQLIEKAADQIEHKDREFKISRNTFNYIPRRDSTHLDQVFLAVDEREDNLFYGFFKNKVMEYVREQNPDLVGIGITDHKQLIPGVILAAMIKDNFPDIKIVVGGHLITRAEAVLTSDKAKRLYDFVDYLIFNEGELPLEMLISVLSSNQGKIEDIPRLAYAEHGKIINNHKGFPILDLNELATPVFDGFIEDQWTPEPYVPIGIYRGCWKGAVCNFCDLNEIFSGFAARRANLLDKVPKRMRSLDLLMQDITTLREAGIKYFSFTDEWFPAGHLIKLSEMLIAKGINDIQFDWYGMIEPKYADAENCTKLYSAGGRFVQFGIESRSEEILKSMQKGYEKDLAAKVLRATSDAGIMNHIFIMVGYPTSSIEEELLNAAFIWENKEFFHTEKTTRFRLSSLSMLALDKQESDKIGISRTSREGDLAVNLFYQGGKLSHSYIEALRLVLDELVRVRNDYAPVMGEFAYGQRLFIGLERLKGMKSKIGSPDEKVRDALMKIWRGLVGQDFAEMRDDIYLRDKKTPKKLEAFQKMKGQPDDINHGPDWKAEVRSFVRQRFSGGFNGLGELLEASCFIQGAYLKSLKENCKSSQQTFKN